ncbi:MAG: leucine-rich repeat protein [Muribaculaceae bacterium]|nr:leucine-rich repeat protein [Muribaculaceae bacterium]
MKARLNFACVVLSLAMWLPASAYDFMVDGIAYNVNSDGKTVTVTYTERRKSTNYDQITEAIIPSMVVNPATGVSYTVTTIGESAFYSNKTITKLVIPPTIVTMEKDAFGSSLSKSSLYISDLAKWCAINFANATSNPFYSQMPFYLNDELVNDLIIPKGVAVMNSFAFHRCKSLKTLKIEADVPSISRDAFSSCSNLTTVEITGNVSRLDSSAFHLCSKMASITLPESVDTIGPEAFASCSSLTEFICPPNLRGISRETFKQCSKLQRIVLGPKIEKIGQSAFHQCKQLTEINFPNTLCAIGINAFQNCTSLENIDLPILCSDIRHNAFDNTKWYANQPEGIVYAGYVAYDYKGDMPANYHLVLRDSIVGIAQYAFYNQKNLEKITLPFTMFDLGGWCFSQCSNLKEVRCRMHHPILTPSQYNLYGAWAVFLNVNLSNVKLIVPKGCKPYYTQTYEWNQFGEIVEESFPVGDVTGDMLVDVEDVNALINIILKFNTVNDYAGEADVNSSGIVDVVDVNGVINIILGLNIFDQ